MFDIQHLDFKTYMDFTKTHKSRYLENEALFFLQKNNNVNYTSRATSWQKIVL